MAPWFVVSTVKTTNRTSRQRITSCLWFDHQAEEAAAFYVSIFQDSAILAVTRYGTDAARQVQREPGSVMTVTFRIAGQEFMALNGGPLFQFSEAISFAVGCRTQREVDRYWAKLSEGGREQPCGWLKDRYGVSWQIVPTLLARYLADSDARKVQRVMKAMLRMSKIDIATIRKAYAGR